MPVCVLVIVRTEILFAGEELLLMLLLEELGAREELGPRDEDATELELLVSQYPKPT